MKREIVCPECADKVRAGITPTTNAFDVALAAAQGEHVKRVRGESRRSLVCDRCSRQLPPGASAVAVSVYTDANPYFEWEDGYLDIGGEG